MKSVLLLPLVTLPLLLGACAPVVVERHPRRPVVVEHEEVYYRNHPRVRRDVVVVNPRPVVEPRVTVRYYNDLRGRYYIQDGRRVYVNSGVRVY